MLDQGAPRKPSVTIVTPPVNTRDQYLWYLPDYQLPLVCQLVHLNPWRKKTITSGECRANRISSRFLDLSP